MILGPNSVVFTGRRYRVHGKEVKGYPKTKKKGLL